MYFHTDREKIVDSLAETLSFASHQRKAVRIDVDSEGSLRVKIGQGMWSPPIASTVDPYRDEPKPMTETVYMTPPGGCQSHADIHGQREDCIGFQKA